MEMDEWPPGRPPDPPDPLFCSLFVSSQQSQDISSHSPGISAPLSLSSLDAVESRVTRKRGKNDKDTEVNNDDNTASSKRDRTTAPSLIARSKYSIRDVAPYFVFVSLVESDPKSGTSIHPVRFGQFMLKLKVKNIMQDGIKKIGRNRVSVEFKSPEDANAFLDNPLLKEKGYSSVIPTFNITKMGVVKGVPADWSDLECSDNLSSPSGCGKILKIRRLNRKSVVDGKTEWVPTSSVVLTFDGKSLPERVFCCFNSLPVELYHFPTVQCYGCCKYGHTKTNCRSKPRCYRCGGDHFGDGCLVEEPKCFYCDGPHNANSRHCPEHIRQKNIKVVMSENNLSYSEAARKFPPSVTRSFSDVVASSPPTRHPLHSPQTARRNYLSQPSTPTSYKRTFILPPKSHAPLSPGYDHRAHQDIIDSYSFPSLANGCALNNDPTPPKEIDPTIDDIIKLLTILLSKFKLPDHVAKELITRIQSHNIPSPAVEYQERPPQKT